MNAVTGGEGAEERECEDLWKKARATCHRLEETGFKLSWRRILAFRVRENGRWDMLMAEHMVQLRKNHYSEDQIKHSEEEIGWEHLFFFF